MRKPIAVVTKSGGVVSFQALERYAIKSASRQSEADAFAKLYGQQLVQPLYNPAQLANLIDFNTYHSRCCRVKARDVAGQDWQLTPLQGVERPNEAQKAELDQFFSGLSLPVNELLYRVMLDYYSVGWGAVELVREQYDSAKPYLGVYHHPAHTLRAHRDRLRWCQVTARGKKTWFKVPGEPRFIDKDTGDFKDELSEERRGSELLVHVSYSARTAYYGVPEFIPAVGAIHGDWARAEYNSSFFKNYGVPAFAVFVSGDYEEGEIDPDTGMTALEAAVKEHFDKLRDNPFSTLFLSVPSMGGEKVQVQLIPLATDIKEASFRLFRKDNRDEVLTSHGVPPYRVGVAETGSLGGNTAAESTGIYFESVVAPHQTLLEHLFNTHLVWNGFEAHDWRLQIMGVDRSDDERDLDMLIKLEDAGAVRPIEIARFFAERFGLDPDETNPALQAYYLKGQPLGQTVTPEELVAVARSYVRKIEKAVRGDGATG